MIRQAYPPRNDVGHKIVWELAEYEGQQAVLEIVDGIDLQAFAWLAVADIEPPVIAIPRVTPLRHSERQIAAAEIAEQLNLRQLEAELRQLVVQQNAWQVRFAAARALAAMQDSTFGSFLIPLLNDESVRPEIRERVCDILTGDEPAETLLSDLFQQLPLRIQLRVAQQMATDPDDATRLVSLIDAGLASRRLLQNATVRERMAAIVARETQQRINELVAGLPPASEQLKSTLAEQLTELSDRSASRANGMEVFKKQCEACHQVGGQGTVIGPQLDGIGSRGRERLVEDVLAPHRNVDAAFQTTIIELNDGRVLSGLLRRTEGETMILVDNQGKEFSVAKKDIDEQSQSRSSIMPDNFAATLDLATRTDLFAYLESLRKE